MAASHCAASYRKKKRRKARQRNDFANKDGASEQINRFGDVSASVTEYNEKAHCGNDLIVI